MSTQPRFGRVTPSVSHGLRHDRSFRLFWMAETISGAGTAIGAVALPLVAVVFLHAPPLTIGFLEAALWAPWLFVGLLAGVVVDRSNQRELMMACDAIAALGYGAVAVIAYLHLLNMPLLIAVSFVAGTVNVFSQATRQTYPPTIVSDDNLSVANSSLEASESVTGFAGAPAAGILTHFAGTLAGVGVNALTFFVSAFLLLISPPSERPFASGEAKENERVGLRAQVTTGIRLVLDDVWLRGSATASAVANFAITGVGTLQALFLVRAVGLPPGWFGPMLMGEGVGGFLGAVCANRLAGLLGTCRALVVCALHWTDFRVFGRIYPAGTLACIFPGGEHAVHGSDRRGECTFSIFRQRYIPIGLLGRTSSAIRVIAYRAAPLGALTGGALAAMVGSRIAILLLFMCGLIRGLLFLRAPWRTRRDLPTEPGANSRLLNSL